MADRITTVIFDIGGVLARYDWRAYLEEHHASETCKRQIIERIFRSGTWGHVDRNRLDDETLERLLCSCVDPEYAPMVAGMFEKRCEYVHEMPDSKDWVASVKQQGYQVYILSNYSRRMFEERTAKMSFWSYVDGQVISYQDGLIKPEPEIYTCLINRYGLVPEECVFVDDLDDNLKAAQAIGIHTVKALSRDHETTRAALDAFLNQYEKPEI